MHAYISALPLINSTSIMCWMAIGSSYHQHRVAAALGPS